MDVDAGGSSAATKPKAQRQGQPPTIDNVEDDEDTYSQRKSHPKKSLNKSRSKATVIDLSDDSDSVQISTKKIKKAGKGSDTEEVGNEKETPEEELGKLSNSIQNGINLPTSP